MSRGNRNGYGGLVQFASYESCDHGRTCVGLWTFFPATLSNSYLAGLRFSVIDTPAVVQVHRQFGQRLASLKELQFREGALSAELRASSCGHVVQLAGV
jgi:hypothetical protein